MAVLSTIKSTLNTKECDLIIINVPSHYGKEVIYALEFSVKPLFYNVCLLHHLGQAYMASASIM